MALTFHQSGRYNCKVRRSTWDSTIQGQASSATESLLSNSLIPTGTIIDDRYEVIEHIGDGGMGNVFKARELGLERIVAIKLIHQSLLGDDEMINRFKREGIVLSQLNHPNLLRCYRFGLWRQNMPYIAMEYLEGVSLTSNATPMPPDKLLPVAAQICEGMAHAHKAHVVHRDLKPTNIMLLKQNSADDLVKILDFGLAGLLPDYNDASKQSLTQTGTVIGSVYYMSPEQCMGRRTDARSDIYSVGCILYECLTGAPPLVADTPVGLMHLHTKEYPVPLSQAVPHIAMPSGLNDVIMRAMAKEPDRRYQTMVELSEALALVATGRGNLIPQFLVESSVSHEARRRRPTLQIVSLVLFIVIGLGAATVLYVNQNRDATKVWSGREPKSESSDLVSIKLLSVSGLDEHKLDPTQVELWIEKFGNRNLFDRAHAYYLLYRANRMTLEESIRKATPDLDSMLSTRTDDAQTQELLFRAASDSVYLLQPKYGRAKALAMVAEKFKDRLDPSFLRRIKEAELEGLRWAGLFEEALARLDSSTTLSGRDHLRKACCLRYLGRLTKSDRQKVITVFQRLGADERTWSETYEAYRCLMELDAPEVALKYAELPQVQSGQYEECYRTIGLHLVGNYDKAEELLQAPELGENRLPLRLWNYLKLSKSKMQAIQQDLLNDFKEHTHDPRSLTRAAYQFSRELPELSNIAMSNAISQLKSDNYLDGFLSIEYIATTLNHLGQPKRAQTFMDERGALRPKNFACVGFDELAISMAYVSSLRLQGKFSDARTHLAAIKKKVDGWPAARPVFEALILAEFARVERDAGNVAEADALYMKASMLAEGEAGVSVIDKVRILEEHSKLCAKMGDQEKSATWKSKSLRLLPAECRTPWTTWMPLSPDYPGLRTIADLE